MNPWKTKDGAPGCIRARAIPAILAACLAAGCAVVRADDGFSGEFEEIPLKGYLIAGIKRLTISGSGEGQWNARAVGNGPDDVVSQTWREMSRDDVRHLFSDGMPVNSIRCIRQGWPMPMFCRVPTKVALSFRENDSSWSPAVSETGYLLAFGSPAGIHSPAFRKVK
ncbi:hypothetical protein [Polaromonas sp.]|uniref:hypothetical protein n=1 Tax=Polaromonas sp. TaxID=1869339 RepID=UPI00326495FA